MADVNRVPPLGVPLTNQSEADEAEHTPQPRVLDGDDTGKVPVRGPVDRALETVIPDMPEAPEAPVANTHIPERIGRYHVQRRLGAGGMAEVFLAERRVEGFFKHVVVKRVLPHLASEQRFRDLLAREARIAARISHPNVVQTFDYDVEGGEAFIVMEYVRGLTMRALSRQAWTKRQPLPLELVVGAIADAADGLHHVHNVTDEGGKPLGLIHRDISPDNLMLSAEGNCKVLDFGIAKVAGGTALTGTGEVKGKVAFMSPEQVRGAAIDHRTDLYALGVSLYYLLTGRRPFGHGDEGGMSNQIMIATAVQVDIPEPPSTLNPLVPAAIDDIVMDLLEKNPDDRPGSGAELADRLRSSVQLSQVVTVGFINEHLGQEPIVDVLGGDGDRLLPEGVRAAEPRALAIAPSAGQKRRAAVGRRATARTAGIAALSAVLSGLLVFAVTGSGPPDEGPVIADPTGDATDTTGDATVVDPGALAVAADPGDKPVGTDAVDDATGTATDTADVDDDNAATGPSGDEDTDPETVAEVEAEEPDVTDDEPADEPAEKGPRKIAVDAPRSVTWRLYSGKRLGTGSGTLTIPAGTRRILAVDSKTGGRSAVRVRSRVSFDRLPSGKLDVRAFPFAEVWLGKQKLGSTPLDPLALPAGRYKVTLKYKGQERVETVRVKPGGTGKVKVAFQG